MGTDIKIDLGEEALAGFISAAILEKLSEDQRDAIIQQALEHLLTPSKNQGYTYGKTPIQQAFDQAAFSAANQICREFLEQDPRLREFVEREIGVLMTIIEEDEPGGEAVGRLRTIISEGLAESLKVAARDRDRDGY